MVERSVGISGFLGMESQPLVLTVQIRVTPCDGQDRCPMDFTTLLARHRVGTGLGDDLMPEAHQMPRKRVDERKSVEFE